MKKLLLGALVCVWALCGSREKALRLEACLDDFSRSLRQLDWQIKWAAGEKERERQRLLADQKKQKEVKRAAKRAQKEQEEKKREEERLGKLSPEARLFEELKKNIDDQRFANEPIADGRFADLLEQKIHVLVNVERQKNGASPLAWNARLRDIARAHSADMLRRNFLSHFTDFELEESGKAIKDQAWRYRQAKFPFTLSAENVAQSSVSTGEEVTYGETFDPEDDKGMGTGTGESMQVVKNWAPSFDFLANELVQGLMRSEDHRKNILRKDAGQQAIGMAISAQDGYIFVTENFC